MFTALTKQSSIQILFSIYTIKRGTDNIFVSLCAKKNVSKNKPLYHPMTHTPYVPFQNLSFGLNLFFSTKGIGVAKLLRKPSPNLSVDSNHDTAIVVDPENDCCSP